MKIAKRLHLHGRVQGVYFRESMCQKASELEITGWVRNLADGSVEALVQGSPARVEQIIEWARRGPPLASVEQMEVEEAAGEFADFRRLPTD
jgi:acylphosphatase